MSESEVDRQTYMERIGRIQVGERHEKKYRKRWREKDGEKRETGPRDSNGRKRGRGV